MPRNTYDDIVADYRADLQLLTDEYEQRPARNQVHGAWLLTGGCLRGFLLMLAAILRAVGR